VPLSRSALPAGKANKPFSKIGRLPLKTFIIRGGQDSRKGRYRGGLPDRVCPLAQVQPTTWEGRGVEGIECQDLCKAYGGVQALDGVSLTAEAGKVLALLGSNGSGKTTTVRILTTLTAPDSGSARVAGKDVVREASSVREAIGFTAQETILDRFLTGKEYMELVARLRHVPRRRRAQETAALLAEFELDEISRARISSYSGGMSRRLDIAANFIGEPAVLFLDEPSTGLDPHSRNRLWEAIRRRADEGTAVLLTTQYMEEADALADSVVVLARGRVIAAGTPSELKDDIGGRVVELTLADPGQVERATAILAAANTPSSKGDSPESLHFVLLKSTPPLLSILQQLDIEGADVSDVIVRRPTLDEAFLHLTRGVGEISGRETTEAAA
jgi:ABC-type multidrug transport system ATPase subunit